MRKDVQFASYVVDKNNGGKQPTPLYRIIKLVFRTCRESHRQRDQAEDL